MKMLLQKLRNLTWTKRTVFAAIGAVTGLTLLLTVLLAPKPVENAPQETSWPVAVISAVPADSSPELLLYGKVETPRFSTLTSGISAYVDNVLVSEGARVSAGDLLVQLDQTDALILFDRRQADLSEAKANLESLKIAVKDNKAILEQEESLFDLAEKKVARHQQLRLQTSISEETLNAVLREKYQQAISLQKIRGLVADANNLLAKAQSQVTRADAAFREAEVNLERTRILAPFDGRVTTVPVSPGERVSPGSVIAEIYDANNLEIRAQIPSAALASLRSMTGEGQINALINMQEGTANSALARLSGEVTAGRSSVDGLFTILDHADWFEVGRSVSLRVAMPPLPNVVRVPIQSLYGNDKLFVVADNRLKGVVVERLGERRETDGQFTVLVRSPDIKAGTQIVTTQLNNAITGLKVETSEQAVAIH